MGGSSSQTCTDPPMSPIHAFPIEDMYTLEFLDSFQQNTGSFQETAREDSPVEVVTSPPKTKKPIRGRQKRTIQSDDAPWQIAWTNAEKIALCKGWVYVSENSSVGNTRKDAGFWCEVLQYMESKTKQRSSNESGASDEDYYARALSKEGSKRYKTSGSSSFNTESGEASINLNANVGDDEEDEVQKIQRPIGKDNAKDAAKKKGSRASGSSSMNDEALARLMVTEMENQEKEEHLAFLEIKMREVECREREVKNNEYRQRQKDIRLYLQPYDHLVGDARAEMESLRAKYNLPY
ncbi:hypothetical protein Tco_0537297 [Tanacetum coccineum]